MQKKDQVFLYIKDEIEKISSAEEKEILDEDDFFVIPNKFIYENKDVKLVLDIAKKSSVINYQYFKVKYKSLKSRLKNKNFNFSNVFK